MYDSDFDNDTEDNYARQLESKCRFYRRQCDYNFGSAEQYEGDESY